MSLSMRSLTYSDAINFDGDIAAHTLADHLVYCFREADASSVEMDRNRVKFKASPFRLAVRPWRALFLLPFDSGNLTVDFDDRKISYILSFRQLAVASSIMVALMLLAPLVSAFSSALGFRGLAGELRWYSPFEAAALAALGWLVFCGGNLLWGIPTFARFVRRAIATAPRYARPTISN